MTENIIYQIEFSVCIWKECTIWGCWELDQQKIPLVGRLFSSSVNLLNLLSTHSIYYWEKSFELSNIILDLSISSFSFVSFGFMYFETLLLVAYMFNIVLTFQQSDIHLLYNLPISFSLVKLCALKLALFDNDINDKAFSAFLCLVFTWNILFHYFPFNLLISLHMEWYACGQHI